MSGAERDVAYAVTGMVPVVSLPFVAVLDFHRPPCERTSHAQLPTGDKEESD